MIHTEERSVAILGAGITGLSIAWQLQKQGCNITIYEKETTPGGVIQSHRSQGWLIEHGPNTLLVNNKNIWNLINELGLNHSVCRPGSEAKKRFIVRNRKLQKVPMSPGEFFATNLLSTGAKFRLLKEPFISALQRDDESIASFIRRRLGAEPLHYAINPFVSGIYAGDPNTLSMRHTFTSLFEMEQQHGSISRGFLKRKKNKGEAKRALISFDNGMQQLPNAMADRLHNSIRYENSVEHLRKTDAGWQLKTNDTSFDHSDVISTIPLHGLPQISSNKKTKLLLSRLAEIEYVPMSVLSLGFKREQVQHPLEGLGMLIPEREPYSFLGCLFSSSLFEKRAPHGHLLLTCFIGGARQPDLATASPHSQIKTIVPELRELLDMEGEPVFHHHSFWKQAIPQYSVGYSTYLKTMQDIEQENPGFFLAGNYRYGVSVPDCILNGFTMAKNVLHYRKNQG